MKFTTLDENQHLNQPIHLCLATLFPPASSVRPSLARPQPHCRLVRTDEGLDDGVVFGVGGVALPRTPEQRDCSQKPSIFLETPRTADSTVSDEPFYQLPSAFSQISTCTYLGAARNRLLGEVWVGGGRRLLPRAWNQGSTMPFSSLSRHHLSRKPLPSLPLSSPCCLYHWGTVHTPVYLCGRAQSVCQHTLV